MEYKGGFMVDENVKNKLSEILSGLNKGKMKGKMSEIADLFKSKEGEALVNSLSDSEKQALIRKFMSMDTDAIDKKLKNFNSDSIKSITADDIKKKLR